MTNTFRQTLALDASYTSNSFQFHLRRIPLIKKLFKSSSYESDDFKVILMVFSTLYAWLVSILLTGLYYLVPAVAAMLRDTGTYAASSLLFFEALFLLTIAGGLANNQLADGEPDEYYAISLLKMNARDFLLSSYFIGYFKSLVLAFVYPLAFCLVGQLSLAFAFIFPLFFVAIKLEFTALRLYRFKKSKSVAVYPLPTAASVILALFLFAAAVTAFVVNLVLPERVVMLAMAAVILIAIPCAIYVWRFEDYYMYFKRYYAVTNSLVTEKKNSTVKANADIVDVKTSGLSSEKTGFAYMNELFIKRHHKLLMDPTKLITAAVAVLVLVSLVLVMRSQDVAGVISGNVIKALPYMPFAFYLINRGSQYSLALFSNCDRSLLNYSFYRKRANILKLFRLRLVGISIQNLYPGLTAGVGFVLVEIFSTIKAYGTENFAGKLNIPELILLFIAPVFISIFFSVHYLMLYYLLQPFDSEAKSKSPVYNIALGLTYVVCYMLYSVLSEHEIVTPFTLGIWIVGFCIAYSVLACLLVYLLAPKTFKNR